MVENKHQKMLKWMKGAKGIIYFSDTISGKEMVTMVAHNCMASSESFWDCYNLLRERVKEKDEVNCGVRRE